MPRHRIVIIGSGFAGLSAARRLRKADADITILARTSHHLFQPLLYQVATGILSEGDIAPTTREILRKQKNVTVLQALVELSQQAPKLTTAQRTERLQEIREATPTISTSMNPAARELHNAAPAEELLRLAELTTAPELAHLLRIAAKHG